MVTQNLLHNRQWAYRKGKSAEQLLIHLKERWREAVEKKLYVGILFVDFTKAFDTVSHNILLQKLNDIGIRWDVWLWLKNYLTERWQVVRINGCDSDICTVTHWVPQGSVLGPTLFSLFTNDLPKSLRSAETYLYADDTTILYRRNYGFANKHTKQCSSWAPGMLRQKFVISTTRRKIKQWSCSGNQHFLTLSKLFVLATTSIIKWTTSERLLGVQVDNKLPWSDHAANVAKSFASKLSLIPRIR